MQILTARKITNEGIEEGKDFSVDMDTEIAEKRAEIAEIKLLKQLTRIYSYEGLEKLPEKQKELVKKALEENLNSMQLYFKRAHKVILPTEEFKKLSPAKKQDAFKKMITGAQKIIRREQLKEKIAKETDKAKKLYYKGEHAMRTGRFIDAYSYYRQFQKTDIQFDHDNPDERKKALELSMDAAEKLKIASFRIIDLADRYIMAAAHKIHPEAAKQALQLTKKVRNLIKRGEAQDLHSAMSKLNSNWRKAPKASPGRRYLSRGSERAGGGTSQLFPTSAAGKSKIVMTLQGHILKRLAVATEHTDDDKRFKAMLNEARSARDNKLYEATSVLLKEAMGPELARHRRELQATSEYGKKLKEIRNLSYFERLEIVAKVAPKLARKTVGEEKFNNLPKEQQEQLIKRFADMLIEKKIRAREQKYVFNSYLKEYKGARSAAAAEFIDMENPFDDWSPWKWSDRAWDNIKNETLINGMMMAVSGGFANLARGAATYGGRALAARILGSQIAKSLPARVGVGLAAFGTEVLTFETGMAGMQYLSGNKQAFDDFGHRLIHGGRVLGAMHIGGRIITPLLSRLTPYAGMSGQELSAFKRAVQKAVPRTLSAAGFEAPLLTWMSMTYDKPEGMSGLSIYANSLKDIVAIGVGRKIFNSATGNLFPRMTTKYQVRSKILDLKGSKSAAEAAKGQLLDGLMKKGEIPLEAIAQISQMTLNANQIANLSRFMKDPQNQQFLLAMKAAQEGGATPKELDTVYRRIVNKLKSCGLSAAQAGRFIKSMSLRGLLSTKTALKSTYEKTFGNEILRQKAEEFMIKNKERIKRLLKKPDIKRAFLTFIFKCQGKYELFRQKHPKLAKILPKDLTKLKIIPVHRIGLFCGLPIDFKSAHEMMYPGSEVKLTPYDKSLPLKIGRKLIMDVDGNGILREVEIIMVDAKKGIKIRDVQTGERILFSPGRGFDLFNRRSKSEVNEITPGMRNATVELRKIGFGDLANKLLNFETREGYFGEPLTTPEQIKSYAEMLKRHEILRKEILDIGILNIRAQSMDIKDGARYIYHDNESIKIENLQQRINVFEGLLSRHRKLEILKKQIIFLAPHYKKYIENLTDYKRDFRSRQERLTEANKFLDLATRFANVKVTPEQADKLLNVIESPRINDLIRELVSNYGGDPNTIWAKAQYYIRKIKAWIKKDVPNLTDKQVNQIVKNEIGVVTRALRDTDEIFRVYPRDKLPTIEQSIQIAEFFRIYETMKLYNRMHMSSDQIIEEVFRKKPGLRNSLSENQTRLIRGKLEEIRNHQIQHRDLMDSDWFKNNKVFHLKEAPADVKMFILDKLQSFFPKTNFTSLNIKVTIGGYSGTGLIIYLPEEIYVAANYSKKNPSKKWENMSHQERMQAMRDDWSGGVNYGTDMIVVKGLSRKKSTELHEETHKLGHIFGTYHEELYYRAENNYKKGNYREYLKMRFLKSFIDYSEEIIAYIKEGRGDYRGLSDKWDNNYADHYLPKIDFLPPNVRRKIMPDYFKHRQSIREAIKDATTYALEIVKYENGFNMLRFTNVTKWGELLNHLSRSQSSPKINERTYDISRENMHQDLSRPNEAVTINNISGKNIRISLPGSDNIIIKQGTNAGYFAMYENNRNVFMGIWHGQYHRFGREHSSNTKFDHPMSISRDHFHIQRFGDTITIINKSNFGIEVDTF